MLKELLLIVHITAGFLALVGALVAILTKMFNSAHKWHIYSGRVFFGGMVAIFLTAIPISLITGNVFLFLVAIFSVYFALSGWSYAKNRKGIPQRVDWLRSYGMLTVSVIMASYGAYLLLSGNTNGITMLVFSGIGASLSISDIKILRSGGVTGKERISRHLSMMLAGFIATSTAFIVVNFTFEPAFVLWLAPTVVITPVIIVWKKKIRRGTVPQGMPQNDV